ncbi:hypothetical protein RRG08_046972 [Elysia crispata]|uniref:Uncharacterized protein n=1 Tax=Elysia crispata TaxID=231223 RepID=A0AAE1DVL1_9GAST|nr:hypothetical protein RRG08_046972 [Elysia crispata]
MEKSWVLIVLLRQASPQSCHGPADRRAPPSDACPPPPGTFSSLSPATAPPTGAHHPLLPVLHLRELSPPSVLPRPRTTLWCLSSTSVNFLQPQSCHGRQQARTTLWCLSSTSGNFLQPQSCHGPANRRAPPSDACPPPPGTFSSLSCHGPAKRRAPPSDACPPPPGTFSSLSPATAPPTGAHHPLMPVLHLRELSPASVLPRPRQQARTTL